MVGVLTTMPICSSMWVHKAFGPTPIVSRGRKNTISGQLKDLKIPNLTMVLINYIR